MCQLSASRADSGYEREKTRASVCQLSASRADSGPKCRPIQGVGQGDEDLHLLGGDFLCGHSEGPYRFQPGSPAEAASRQ